jgi:hypothetical protein
VHYTTTLHYYTTSLLHYTTPINPRRLQSHLLMLSFLHIWGFGIVSRPILSCLLLSFTVFYYRLVRSCPVLSCPVLSCPVLYGPVPSCPVPSCLVPSCLELSRLVLSRLVLSRLVLNCPVLCWEQWWQLFMHRLLASKRKPWGFCMTSSRRMGCLWHWSEWYRMNKNNSLKTVDSLLSFT